MGKKADEYKNKVLVENYKQLNRKLVTLSGIGVRQLLGTRPEADSRTEYVTKLALKIDATAAMTEVVHNPISNAIKCNDKPHPVVEVGCVGRAEPQAGQPEYVIHFRDNGLGIKAEYFERIFQIFQRLQRDDEGTG